MKVLFFLPYSQEAAACRYRIHQYLPFLEANGIRCELRELVKPELYRILYKPGHHLAKVISFAGRTVARLRDLLDARDYDVLFVHRECFPFGPPMMERLLASLSKPVVFDFDDAIYLPTGSLVKDLLRTPGKVTKIIHMASQVIVSTDHLKGLCAAYNRNVSVIPTSVDTEKVFFSRNYAGRLPPEDGRPVRLGWIGSHSTARYLERLAAVLPRIANRYKIELLVMGAGRPIQFPGVKVLNQTWTLEGEAPAFRSLDIGLYPLDDDLWERGKASFKTVQYMASGVPGVVSPVGPAVSMISDGENGFLADSDQEWEKKIGRLVEDPALRLRIAEAGRLTAERLYSTTVNAPRLLAVLRAAQAERIT